MPKRGSRRSRIMSFISVLKRIGGKSLPILNTVLGLAPNIMQLTLPQTERNQQLESEVAQIGVLVKTAEAVGEQVKLALGQPVVGQNKVEVSALKAAALLPSVRSVLLASSAFVGHRVVDEARFTAGCQKVLDGVVDLYDSVDLSKP
jgi:hypothetical protein